MKGTMHILHVDGTVEIIDYETKLATLDEIEEDLGGAAHRVPTLNKYEGQTASAFSLKQVRELPFNANATLAWQKAVADDLNEVLAGPVVILTGTPEFVGGV
jgi:hypothetical protein